MSEIITIPFTSGFLEALVARIETQWIRPGRPLDRLSIVFGGKRPEYFVKRLLADRIQGVFVPPRFITIDAFMDQVSGTVPGFRACPELEARYLIYQIVQEHYPELLKGRSSFAAFLPWAGDILDFIGELDIEDIDADRLKNIEDSARIGYAVPEAINKLLGQVLDLRGLFHQRLLARRAMTRGLRYRRAAENVRAWQSPCEEIIFANFFYFHRTEETVARDLYRRGVASLVFQGDQRKWPVLERVARQFGTELKEKDASGKTAAAPLRTNFRLSAYYASDAHAEAVAARDILKSIPAAEWGKTVIVLPDPKSLVALLSALPESGTDLNVSMGYSLKRSSLYLLLQLIFKAQLSRKGEAYYAKDYLEVLHHPLVKNLGSLGDPAVTRILVHKVEEALKGRLTCPVAGKLFVTRDEIQDTPAIFAEAAILSGGQRQQSGPKELQEVLFTLHELFFASWERVATIAGLTRVLGVFLETMQADSPMGDYPLNRNVAARLEEMRREWAGASFAAEPFAQEEVFRMVEDMAGRETVHFKGTPLKGLQVLGLFETRSLDFKHVIVMDANERVLPRVEEGASLIPREVMAQLGIDRLKLDEEIQRYQFMRIISSAEQVHVIYQKNKEKEPSRFLEELIWEQQRRDGELKPYPTKKVVFGVDVRAAPRAVVKTPGMMAFLKDFEYSASSINMYLRNPYEFYGRYVSGVRKQENMLEESDAAQIGTFFHDFLEEVYKPFVGKPFAIGDEFRHRFEQLFDARFEAFFGTRRRSDAFMIRVVMHGKLRQFLEFEEERAAQIERVVAVEEDFKGDMALAAGTFRFKAKVDRIEEHKNGLLMVLDYKTGTTDKLPQRPLEEPVVWTRQLAYDRIRSFQLPLYMWLVARKFPGRRIDSGLYSLRETSVETFSSALDPYWRALDVLMAGIMDPNIPFEDNDLADEG